MREAHAHVHSLDLFFFQFFTHYTVHSQNPRLYLTATGPWAPVLETITTSYSHVRTRLYMSNDLTCLHGADTLITKETHQTVPGTRFALDFIPSTQQILERKGPPDLLCYPGLGGCTSGDTTTI